MLNELKGNADMARGDVVGAEKESPAQPDQEERYMSVPASVCAAPSWACRRNVLARPSA